MFDKKVLSIWVDEKLYFLLYSLSCRETSKRGCDIGMGHIIKEAIQKQYSLECVKHDVYIPYLPFKKRLNKKEVEEKLHEKKIRCTQRQKEK
jgi:hypothetical protein